LIIGVTESTIHVKADGADSGNINGHEVFLIPYLQSERRLKLYTIQSYNILQAAPIYNLRIAEIQSQFIRSCIWIKLLSGALPWIPSTRKTSILPR
jgi:hypothetical protein